MAMEVTWYVADILTGQVLGELPLSVDGMVGRRIAAETQQGFNLPTSDKNCPAAWHEIVVPGKTMVVLCFDQRPVQGWAIDDRKRGTTIVPINGSTFETFPSRSNVPGYPAEDDFTTDIGTVDLSQVAAAVASPLIARFGVTIEWTACGVTNPDLTPYSNLEDRSILAALNDLMAAEKGPEWRIYPRWVNETTRRQFDKVLEIGPKIGDDRPDAVFDLDPDGRGDIETYEALDSFAAGKGATMVIGTSDGSGSSRPMTEPLIAGSVALGWPVWEERISFSSLDASDDPDAALDSRARAALAQRSVGATTYVVTGDTGSPVPGVDYQEGDTVRLQVAPQDKLDPVGAMVSPRVLGWEVDPATGRANPLLWDTSDLEGNS